MKKKIFYLKAKKLDIHVGERLKILLNEGEAWKHGITELDKVGLLFKINGVENEIVVDADLSTNYIKTGEIGLTKDVLEKYKLETGNLIGVYYVKHSTIALKAIKKKLLGKRLTDEEIYALIKDINDGKLSNILISYYAACSYAYHTTKKELYLTTKYSALMGDMLEFEGQNFVKYCIGGLPGNETTLGIVPILKSLGIKSPKTFSKAITSPSATGECVEVLTNTNFNLNQMKHIVHELGVCLVWSKPLKLAPANDKIIEVSYPLSMEAYSKMVVGIMAKIYAGGTKNCLIDIPVGPNAKIKSRKVAKKIKSKFEYIGKKLNIKMKILITDGKNPFGKGIGAVLQVREILRILQQKTNRSKNLENKIIYLTSELLKLQRRKKNTDFKELVKEKIENGDAYNALKEIIEHQNQVKNSKPDYKNISYLGMLDSEELPLAKYNKQIKSKKNGIIKNIDISILKEITRTLGCPADKQSGLYFEKTIGEKINEGEILFTIYTNINRNIEESIKILNEKTLVEIL